MRKQILGVLILAVAVSSAAIGAVPEKGRVLDDTVIYQNLSEIRAAKEKDLNFDHDIARLNGIESQYREKLPSVSQHPRVKAPMERVSAPVKKGRRSHKAHVSSRTRI